MGRKHTHIETVTHAAGPVVQVRSRFIQRCCVCGEKLADSNNMTSFWTEGELITVRDGAMRSMGVYQLSLTKYPRDFCINLVEE